MSAGELGRVWDGPVLSLDAPEADLSVVESGFIWGGDA